jgi:uncharacterized membrane protein
MQDVAERLDSMERRLERLERRTGTSRRLDPEAVAGAAAPTARPGHETPAGATAPTPRAPAGTTAPAGATALLAAYAAAPVAAPAAPPKRSLEDLLGLRVMGIVGGVAVLLGIAFFVAVAVGRGWIDEPTRVLLAYLGSGALLAAGAWLHENRGRTQASLAMVGAAVGGLFVTTVVASEAYELVPSGVGLAAAAAVGAAATALALRWDSRTLAGLGILGALATPVLVLDDVSTATLAYVAVALAASTGVLVRRRWGWLAVGALVVTAPQLALWSADAGAGELVVFALAFWALYVGGALGYELRVSGARPRRSSTVLVLAAGAIAGAVGYAGLAADAGEGAAQAFVGGLAAAHLVAGLAALRSPRVARQIALILLAGAVTLGDLAFGLAADGAVVSLGWAASAVLLALLARLSRDDADVLRVGVAAQTGLALLHVLAFDAPPGLVGGAGDATAGLVAIGSVGMAAFVAARLLGDERHARSILDVVAMLALAYGSAVALEGTALTTAWALETLALARLAAHERDRVAAGGALAFLGLAGLRAVGWDAPPDALLYGSTDFGGAALALGAVGLACLALARIDVPAVPAWRTAASVAGAGVGLYLASIGIVTALPPETGVVDPVLADLGARQPGQVALSAFWGLLGLAALVAGLVRDERRLRLAGLAVLGLAVAKVFAFDLPALDSLYRAASLLGLGLALLAGAFAYQRMRDTGLRARAAEPIA